MAKEYLIGDFLKRVKRPIELDPNQDYNLVTIKMNHKGVVLRGSNKGSDIKSKMFEVKEGDFILSGIDARNGAFGIVPKELEGAIVTNDFWYFEVDENIILKQLFLELTTMSWFDEICRKGSDGTTQRIRLQKNKFFNQRILLPEANEQKYLLDKLLTFKKNHKLLNVEFDFQKRSIIQLKQSILQEAVQGKLTIDWRANNPNIEDAVVLLKRIQKEKAQLIKDKKIKKETPLPAIAKDEIPYELPEGWVWCRMQEIGLFERGRSKHRPRNDSRLFQGGKYPLIQTGDVSAAKKHGGKITTIKSFYNDFGLAQSLIWKKGTLCITIAANIAETGFLDFDACFPDSVVGFTEIFDNGNYLANYVEYFITLTKSDLEKYAPSTAQKNINLGILYELKFPLPPQEEQKAIVQKVKDLMELCDCLENEVKQSQEQSEQLMQSVLIETFN